ncbi:phosphotransferase [Trichophyton tonsurans CBS 112818]|uniref:Phosphotransferase enzyme family protein n=2 Tax=Trichophyton TaxID=5550 RepID=F2PTJ6_TRIEC|nr:phosphotransferase [Trichophyton tonsurans CBS 112818]EGE05214.1 phosphotransferase enzyme family protein [Trichophyton equinum CBS 127.97]
MAGEVRQPIDQASFERFIDAQVPSIKTPLTIKQFGFGQSNPTYQLISADGAKYVLRKKPPGKLLSKTAHRVEREYQIIHALEKTDVPVPRTICLCEDESVIGTAFYIMEFLDGRIFVDPAMPGVTPDERRELWKAAVQTLARFHRVDPRSVGLDKFGRSGNFYDRQLATFQTIHAAQASTRDIETGRPVSELPHFDELVAFFSTKSSQPLDRSSLIHGDYKIDNMVFHRTESRVIGVLDWEMATIGHPLSDLCNLTGPYANVDGGPAETRFRSEGIEGLPTRDECVRWYGEVSGWAVSGRELGWGDAFHAFRGSIIMQGIAARYALRQASSARAREYASLMSPFARKAWEKVSQLKDATTTNNNNNNTTRTSSSSKL